MLFLRGIIRKQPERIRICSLVRGLQNGLDVGKQWDCCATQQSRPYRWMVGSRQLSSAELLPVTQLPPVSAFTSRLLHCDTASRIQMNLCPRHPLFTVVRFRRRKMQRKSDESEPSAGEDEVNQKASTGTVTASSTDPLAVPTTHPPAVN